MKYQVVVPSPGESINEVFIGTWLKKTGDHVKKDEILVDLETQKTTFELQAEQEGRIEILFPNPETVVKPGDVIAIIDDSVAGTVSETPKASVASAKPASAEAPRPNLTVVAPSTSSHLVLSPAARKQAADRRMDPFGIPGSGRDGRIMKEDVLKAPAAAPSRGAAVPAPVAAPSAKASESPYQYRVDASRGERIEPATRIRRQIAQNLVAAQHTAAILTTFNEVDMSSLIAFRKKHKEALTAKYGTPPGIVSFFAMASLRALKEYPLVNATFTGEDIISRDFVDMGIAVSTESGLVVPVVRDAQKLSLMAFENRLGELAEKARLRKLSIPEMTGGSFTISNGGVFGSLISTPIINMPQSAILGLHKTQERPIAREGLVVIAPMMYLALSYDHRIIDGREAVLFLVKIKEGIENLDLILNTKELL